MKRFMASFAPRAVARANNDQPQVRIAGAATREKIMRKDTILMVIAVAAVAAVTYYGLETLVEQPEPQLSSVVPDEPQIEAPAE
jgi:homoaconitase/3-isopropylmalate dehydratase large subunit